MKSIKVGILTFHAAHNYGSMLQAYALQTFLTDLGIDASIINYRGAAQSYLYMKPYKYWDKSLLLGRLKNPTLLIKNMKKWNKFEKFMLDFMHLTFRHSTIEGTICTIKEEQYDVVITGGDQIWAVSNPDFYMGYFLPFYIPKCRKVSYAVSIGDERWTNPQSIDFFFKSMLNDYDVISVREKSTADIISHILNKQVLVMPDPAFLIDTEKYNLLTKNEAICRKKYLLYYDPKKETDPKGYLYKYARSRGLYALNSNSYDSYIRHFINKNDSGPAEFINLVKNAEIICGYSMHLIIFALLYHKPFIVISDNPDARLKNLLIHFNLMDRIIPYEELNNNLTFRTIDWITVDSKIQELREEALLFFKSVFDRKTF